MRRATMALGVLTLAGCSGSTQAVTPSPAPTSSPSAADAAPTQSASPSPAGTPRCHTADLEVAIASEGGAAGLIGLEFEVRNRSAQQCRVFGYFGLALLNSEGKVAIAAQRSTHIFLASTGPPQVLLPSGSAPLSTAPATGGPPPAVTGHAYFAADYSDVCDNAPNGTGNAWQLYPPDETQPTSLLTSSGQDITACGLEETPVQPAPPTP